MTTLPHAQAPLWSSVRAFLANVFSTMVESGDAKLKLNEARDLMAMSDAQLAQRHLPRQRIVRHVFVNNYWT